MARTPMLRAHAPSKLSGTGAGSVDRDRCRAGSGSTCARERGVADARACSSFSLGAFPVCGRALRSPASGRRPSWAKEVSRMSLRIESVIIRALGHIAPIVTQLKKAIAISPISSIVRRAASCSTRRRGRTVKRVIKRRGTSRRSVPRARRVPAFVSQPRIMAWCWTWVSTTIRSPYESRCCSSSRARSSGGGRHRAAPPPASFTPRRARNSGTALDVRSGPATVPDPDPATAPDSVDAAAPRSPGDAPAPRSARVASTRRVACARRRIVGKSPHNRTKSARFWTGSITCICNRVAPATGASVEEIPASMPPPRSAHLSARLSGTGPDPWAGTVAGPDPAARRVRRPRELPRAPQLRGARLGSVTLATTP
jgi:hypothetical protein